MIFYTSTPTHIPNDPAKIPSTIDLIITNGLHNSSHPISVPLGNSDHNAVTIDITTNESCLNTFARLQSSYRDANWNKYRQIIHNNVKKDKLLLNNISNIDKIENHMTALSKLIEQGTKEAVSLKFHNKYFLHLTPEIQGMVKDRNMLRKRWQR